MFVLTCEIMQVKETNLDKLGSHAPRDHEIVYIAIETAITINTPRALSTPSATHL